MDSKDYVSVYTVYIYIYICKTTFQNLYCMYVCYAKLVDVMKIQWILVVMVVNGAEWQLLGMV